MRYYIDDEILIDSDIVVNEGCIIDSDIIDGDRVVIDDELVTPHVVVADKGLIYRGVCKTVDSQEYMVNGKAPYGSSEDDAVWTVYINPLDEYGNVVDEEIEVLYNQIWSEIKNMYN